MEINLEEFQTLLSQLTSFDKMYEQVRFVDPVKKEVLFVKHKNQEEIILVLESCFGIWGKGEVCKNCILGIEFRGHVRILLKYYLM